jgi:O-antigen/teichoic acid export membrane protein
MEKPENFTYDPDISGGLSLSDRATRSSVFLLIAKCIRYLFVFIVQLLLMNLLVPSDFGLVRFVAIIIGIINLVNELGLSFAVIQKKSLLDSELSSAFTLNAVISSAVYGAIFFSAPLCASFFGNEQITALVRVGAFASFFGALSVVHRSLLQRRLNYGRLAIIEMASAAAGSSGALVLALCGFGVWSLLASMVIFNMLSSLILMATIPWPRGNYLQLAPAKTLSIFGGTVVIQRVLEYCVQNFDYLVVGKAFGEKILGIYTIAHTLMTLPQMALGVVIGSVLLSTFSRIQDDDQRLAAAFLKVNILTSIISVPYFVLIFSYAHEMMHAVSFINKGDAWVPAAIPIKILALLGLLFAYSSYPGTIWISKGKIKLRIYWGIFGLITVIAAVIAGRPLGLNGICYALVIRGIILFPILLLLTQRVIGLKPFDFIKVLLPSIFCGMGMLVVTGAFSLLIPGASFGRDVWTLIAGSVVGIAVYFLLLFFFFKDTFNTFLEMVMSAKEINGKVP